LLRGKTILKGDRLRLFLGYSVFGACRSRLEKEESTSRCEEDMNIQIGMESREKGRKTLRGERSRVREKALCNRVESKKERRGGGGRKESIPCGKISGRRDKRT